MKRMTMALLLVLAGSFAQAENRLVLGEGAGASRVSAEEVRDMFLGRKSLWGSGAKVRVCLMRGMADGDRFFTELLKRSERDFNAYWVRRLFSGDGVPPVMVTSSRELGDFLAANAGAICYVGTELVAGLTPPPPTLPLP